MKLKHIHGKVQKYKKSPPSPYFPTFFTPHQKVMSNTSCTVKVETLSKKKTEETHEFTFADTKLRKTILSVLQTCELTTFRGDDSMETDDSSNPSLNRRGQYSTSVSMFLTTELS